ncbi:MAG: phosphatidate cytidylyltransferase [Oscillospiraceae bacterium]|jgi:phosphatidate cytidylyltransferase|nr:phosphatidate cytidylyltransferase [Oscillospiraceae bacterium]
MLKRLVTGLVSAGILVLFMFAPSSWLRLALMLVAVWGVTETLDAFTIVGHEPIRWPGFIACALMIPSFLLLGTRAPLPMLALILMLTTLNIAIRAKPSWIDAAAALYAAFTVIVPMQMMLAIDTLADPPGRWMVFAAFAIPLMGDVCALYIGHTWGRRRLNPALSPNKTWEGAAGGLFGSVAGAVLLGYFGARYAPVPKLSHWIALGLVGGIAGQLGDFSASLVKRWCGVKDFGVVFPGHGGIMDRFDSVLFTTYVIYCYCIIFV